jgi:glycosyltransferase involved in cell wall biosynthesis
VDPVGPLVTIVIPTFNRPDQLPGAVESALGQTYGNIEVIVHDNGSDVDPRDILSSVSDPRLKIFRNSTNLGVAKNFSLGLAKATGDYVGILGDDDRLEPDFVAKLVRPLEEHPEVIVSFSSHCAMRDGIPDEELTIGLARYFGLTALEPGLHPDAEMLALVIRAIPMVTGSLLRASAAPWSSIPEVFGIGTDIYMMYLVARSKVSCYFVKERLVRINYAGNTLTTKMKSSPEARVSTARGAMHYWTLIHGDTTLNYRSYYRLKMTHAAVMVIYYLTKQKKWREALTELRSSISRGLFMPSALMEHLSYQRKLRDAGVTRKFMP